MKKPNGKIEKSEEGFELKLHSRPTKKVSIEVPEETLASLEKVAASRDMSVQALIKFYIGQSLRHDISNLFANSVLEKTEQVLQRHIKSKDEVSEIIREIRTESP